MVLNEFKSSKEGCKPAPPPKCDFVKIFSVTITWWPIKKKSVECYIDLIITFSKR